jgi:hypothetical protein
MRIRSFAFFLVFTLMVSISAGCSFFMPAPQPPKADPGKTVQINTKDGSTTVATAKQGGSVALPDGYPAKILPIFPDSQIVVSNQTQGSNKKTAFNIVLSTTKSVADATAFYKQQLSGAKNLNTGTTADTSHFIGEKDGYTLMVQIGPKKEKNNVVGTMIHLAVGPAN